MTIELQRDDFKRLVTLLQNLPDFANVRDRRRLVAGALEGSPRASALLGGLDLDGAPRAVAVEVVRNLAQFGQVVYGKEALGVFLNELLDRIGEGDDEDFIRGLFQRYPLDQPATRNRPIPLDQWHGTASAEDVREKIIGEDTLRDIRVLELALTAARTVVRVGLPGGAGSGFMIAPDLLMTNHHVIASPDEMQRAEFTFNYQLDRDGKACETITVGAQQDGPFHTHPELDYTIVGLADPPNFGAPLPPRAVQVQRDERVNIIQHPGGHFKKISMQNNFVAYADKTVVQYYTSTLPGSSDSPVFNDDFDVIAIHHSGGMLEEPGTGRRYLRNAGTSMIAVLADLEASAPEIHAQLAGDAMTEIERPLIKDLTDLLWPLLETEGDREEWLDVALADLTELRGGIDWSGSARRFTRRLVSELLTQQGEKGRRGLVNLLDDIAEHKGAEWQPNLQLLRDRVTGFAPGAEPAATPPPPALLELRDRLRGQDVPIDLDLAEETVQAILRYRPRDLTAYRVARIAEWSQPRFALDKRFVQLALLLDHGENAQGTRFVEQPDREFKDLGEVLAVVPDPAVVLLGAPGAGKSTLLRRFELDTAREVLTASQDEQTLEAPLTFFIPLNTYRSERPDASLPAPRDWLYGRWADRYAGLPPLENLLQAGRMTLLLDALNEIPHPGDEPVRLWKAFLAELNRTYPGNRVIFSCRSLDYSASLSSPELPVPQVRIKSLSDERVQRFLALYCPRYADTLWDNLKDTPQLELLRTPYFLRLLVDMTTTGEVPEGRAALFTGFVRQALVREVQGNNPLFRPNELLTQRDCRRLEQARRRKAPYYLPTRGILVGKLCALAHAMQEQHSEQEAARIRATGQADTLKAGEGSQVRIGLDDALDILDHPRDEDILKAGEALGVLDEDDDNEEVLYRHQLLQEYFAARPLAEQPEPDRVRVAWEVGKTSPNLEEVLAQIADYDPLPPLPGTGWEETTVLATAMTADADAFVTRLMEVNLPLAGRCAAQLDVTVSATLNAELGQALIGRTQDSNADLRARIAAGLALGELCDPRFERPDGDYLLPPLAAIDGGLYALGSDKGHYDDESPVHTVELEPFLMGKFPVTNAEWALFMKAGGYEDERWWVTEEDKAWRRGDLGSEGAKKKDRAFRKARQTDFDSWRVSQRDWTSADIESVEGWIRMTDDEFEAQLDEWYPAGRQTQPSEWNDDAFNNPAQPVVGVSWYEARAYCAWLSAQTDRGFRLPTEGEWEAAARGRERRRFAYGNDFDAARCNTLEAHIRRTTPVGIFPGGETPDTGLVDMTGNVWEWTGSLYESYPYTPSDGRENPITGDGRRMVRGGSWAVRQARAAATFRSPSFPGHRVGLQGFRVVCSSPIFRSKTFMTIELQRQDFKRLVTLLQKLPDFANVRDRRRLVEGALEGSPRAPTLLATLDLDGSPRGVATEIVRNLTQFGQVTHGKEALGVFLNELLELIGEGDDDDFIRSLFARYPLDQPTARNRPVSSDHSHEILSAEDLPEKAVAPPSAENTREATMTTQTLKVFVTYSHKDAAYLEDDSLLGFLKGLEKTEGIALWTDQKIMVGDPWDEVIKHNLRDSRIALVLVSEWFLDSPYCQDVEIQELLAGKAHLIPIILSPCSWRRFEWLSSRQFLPGGDETIEEHYTDAGQRKRLYLTIKDQLREIVGRVRQVHQALEPGAGLQPYQPPYSGKTRVLLCRQLGRDWPMLADYLEIPPYEQDRFEHGGECRGILVWLENRRRLEMLPEALSFVGREDLAELLANDSATG